MGVKIDEIILEKFLEDDLSLQLKMLKGELSDSSKNELFPDYDDSSISNDDASVVAAAAAATPQTVSASVATTTTKSSAIVENKQPNFGPLLLLENEKAELIQGVTESALICALLGVFMMIDMLFADGYFSA